MKAIVTFNFPSHYPHETMQALIDEMVSSIPVTVEKVVFQPVFKDPIDEWKEDQDKQQFYNTNMSLPFDEDADPTFNCGYNEVVMDSHGFGGNHQY